MRWMKCVMLWLCLLWMCAAARADKHALLIGIDDYDNKDAITTLSAASADARALGKTLQEVAGFPVENVRVLVSDGALKPTRNQILSELSRLARNVKAGDTVFVLYSGHGIDLGDGSRLLPYDTDPTDDFTLRESTIGTATFTQRLADLPATGVVMAFDMCRTNPFKGDRAATSSSTLTSRQARDLIVQPTAGGKGVRAAVTLYSCSINERSWEWREKKRGFFSYFLEQGLRSGVVRVSDIVPYLEKQVSEAVQRENGQSQTPWAEVRGTGALGLELARRQSTLPPAEAPVEPTIESLTTIATLRVATNPTGAKVFVDEVEQNGVAPCNIEIDLGRQRTKTIEVAVELNGYKPALRRINVSRGASAPLSIDLEKLPQLPAGPTSGATKINPTDGAAMVYVPAGEFLMGSTDEQIKSNWQLALSYWRDATRESYGDQGPQRRVYLDGYWMYKYEVTVAQYRQFCTATGRAMPNTPKQGWNADHPIVNVSWEDATAYCAWANVELPTEAQWEKAARGTDGRLYTWGNEWPPRSRVGNFADETGKQKYPTWKYTLAGYNDGYAETAPVGSFAAGASPYGCMDMAGNVWEWCADWYGAYDIQSTSNPTGVPVGRFRVLRGGSWYAGDFPLRTAFRGYIYEPRLWDYGIGFRCVQGRP